MLPIIDIILIIFLAGFIFYGFFFGLIRTIGALAGLAGGLWLASRFYLPVFNWAEEIFFGYDKFGKVFIFLLMFSLANRLVVLGFVMLDRTFKILSIIPFLKSINRLAGAIFGFLLGSSILSLVIYAASFMPFISNWLGKALLSSKVMLYLAKVVGLMSPLIPGMLEKINGLIKRV